MTAAVMHAPGDIRVEEVPVPSPGPGEVLLKVAACGVCGSDIPRMLRNGGYVMPIICGHEFSAHVETLGEGVTGFSPGDLVSVPPLIPCRHCDFCVRGDFGLCEDYDYFGSRSDGAYAQYVVSPVGNLLLMPEGLDPRAAAMLDPAAIALHALWKTGLRAGHRVLVVGAGPIGLFAVQWARLHGAAEVVTIDLSEEKSAMAREAGADHAVQTLDEAKALAGRGFDVVLESAGVAVTADMAARLVGPEGARRLRRHPARPRRAGQGDLQPVPAPGGHPARLVELVLGPVPGRRVARVRGQDGLRRAALGVHDHPRAAAVRPAGDDAEAGRAVGALLQGDLRPERGLSVGLLLGLDLGTEGARVGAFTEDGAALGSVHRPYATSFPRAGWAEQDPEAWWAAVVDAARTLLATDACRAAGPVLAVASATTASTVAVLDADGRPLRPAILWMDSRASAQAARTAGLADRHPVLAWSGGSDASEWLLPKAVWLKEHEPATWARAARVVEALDYLTFRLTGRWVGSQMNAVCKYNYDGLRGAFPVELYADLGVADLVERLPDQILPVGSVAGPLTAEAAAAFGTAAGAPVVVGGIDAHVSLLSCGASEDVVSLVSGTSSAIIAEVDEPTETTEIWGPYPHALRTTKWLVEGGQVTSGSVLTWAGRGHHGRRPRRTCPALVDGRLPGRGRSARAAGPRHLHGQPDALPRRPAPRRRRRADPGHHPGRALPGLGRGRGLRHQGRRRLLRARRRRVRPAGVLRRDREEPALAAGDRRRAGPRGRGRRRRQPDPARLRRDRGGRRRPGRAGSTRARRPTRRAPAR